MFILQKFDTKTVVFIQKLADIHVSVMDVFIQRPYIYLCIYLYLPIYIYIYIYIYIRISGLVNGWRDRIKAYKHKTPAPGCYISSAAAYL